MTLRGKTQRSESRNGPHQVLLGETEAIGLVALIGAVGRFWHISWIVLQYYFLEDVKEAAIITAYYHALGSTSQEVRTTCEEQWQQSFRFRCLFSLS